MSDHNFTLGFALPLPAKAMKYLAGFITDSKFHPEWDEGEVDLDSLPRGVHSVFSRGAVDAERLLENAKCLGFSFTLLDESFAFDCPGNAITFYDAKDSREALWFPCAEDGAPYLTLDEVLSETKEALTARYSLPSFEEATSVAGN